MPACVTVDGIDVSAFASQPDLPWLHPGLISADRVAIVGKSNVLFLYEGSNDYLQSYFELDDKADSLALKWKAYLDKATTHCDAAGSSFTFLVIPNKASVLPSLYPIDLPAPITPRLQRLLRYRNDSFVVPFLQSPSGSLREAFFRRNDTHLGALGNFMVSQMLSAQLGHPESSSLTDFDFKMCRHPGDLGHRFATGMPELLKVPVISAAVSETQLSPPQGKVTGLKIEIFNPKAPIQETVVIFGNSFFERYHGWGITPYLAHGFRRIIFMWSHELHLHTIASYGPAHVILQTCERFLSKPPEIFHGQPRDRAPAISSVPPPLSQATGVGCSPHLAGYDNGVLRLLDYPKEEMTLTVQGRKLADFDPESTPFPWHLLVRHQQELQAHSLVLKGKTTGKSFDLDTTRFFDVYFGPDRLCEKLQQMVAPGKWVVYEIRVGKSHLKATIGCVCPFLPTYEGNISLLCNGQPALQQTCSEDIHFRATHWFMPAKSVLSIEATFDTPPPEDFLSFTLAFAGKASANALRHYRPAYTVRNLGLLDSLPDLPRIKRVAGSISNSVSFMNGGKTAFERLRAIFDEYHSRAANPSLNVLDWGVGCGRVAKHYAQVSGVTLTGIDIDEDNVRWCQEHLTGNYLTVDLMPPVTRLATSYFDLIYSCSVLSHLTQEATDHWLAELSRVLRPDGLALLSFNSSSNLASYLGKRPESLRQALKSGFFDGDANNDLKGFIPSDTYYRATFATDEWWATVFEKHFELVAIERAVVSGYQDIAVLRKK